jgi:hypothetical protein
MSHTLHQLIWMVRRRRMLLAFHALAWFVLTWISWQSWTEENLLNSETLALNLYACLAVLTGLLALDAGRADPSAGTDTFWRTRPPRWRAICQALALYVIIALAGPALVSWAVNGFLLRQTSAQWCAGMLEPLCLLSALLALTGLSSLVRGWTGTITVFGVAGALIYAGTSLVVILDEKWRNSFDSWHESWSEYAAIPSALFYTVVCAAPALAIIALWSGAMRRPPRVWMFIAAALWIVLVPVLAWLPLSRSDRMGLTYTVRIPGEATTSTERDLGLLKLRGVPEEAKLDISYDSVEFSWLNAPGGIPPRDYPILVADSAVWAPGWFNAKAGEQIRSLFPAATHWYSDGIGEASLREYNLRRAQSREPLEVRLKGGICGSVYLPGGTHSTLPLHSGATGPSGGLWLRILEVEPGSRNLEIELMVRQFGSLLPMRPKSIEGVFVLHFPAVPAAVLLYNRERFVPRSPQCSGGRLTLRLTMPDAELAAGARWTPEVLRGAELWHFAPGEETPFIAVPEEGIVTLYPPGER